jgi:hypothetical protein
MSRMLFLTADCPQNCRGNLYVDLVHEFLRHGHYIDVIVTAET